MLCGDEQEAAAVAGGQTRADGGEAEEEDDGNGPAAGVVVRSVQGMAQCKRGADDLGCAGSTALLSRPPCNPHFALRSFASAGMDDHTTSEFWLFGYGSLIFKPPPHYDWSVPGFIKGYVRRFWQVRRPALPLQSHG